MTPEQKAMNCPNGITAIGTVPKQGHTIACKPSWKGKVINLIGLGERVCEDLGGRIKGNRIDVYVDTYEEAINWGVRELSYKVL